MADLSTPLKPRLDGDRLRTLTRSAVLVVLGTMVLAASSWVEVPMIPVPMTLQTLAVCMIGALYGARLGTITVLAWLGQAALGAPVLAGGGGGWAAFFGPTAGYLAAFPLMAGLMGFAAQRGWLARGPVMGLSIAMAAHGLCFALGVSWLAQMIGWEGAVSGGFAPFVPGLILKSVLVGLLAWRLKSLRFG